MKFLYPATIDNTSLQFSSVPETEYGAYGSGTFYPTESFVIFEHYIYQAIAASTGARPDISPTSWTVIGPTNMWAMFDLTRGTSTVAVGEIAVGMQLDQVDALSMINVVGDSVQVTVDQGGVVYDRTITLAGMQSIYLDDLPPSDGAGILVVISGATTGIASLQAGRVFTMGETLHPLGFSITDYSRKDTDEFGNTNLTRRGFSRRTDAKVLVQASNIDECVRLLAGIRATPVVWIATTKYSSAFVLGYYKDWSLDIASHAHAECSISIEGMTEDGLFSYADIIRPGGSISLSAFEDDDVATSTFNGVSELASSLLEDDDVASAAVVSLWEFTASMVEDDDEAAGSVVSIQSVAMYAVEDDDDVSASIEPPTPAAPKWTLSESYPSGAWTLTNSDATATEGTGSQTSIRCDTPISGKRYWECVVSTTTSGTFDAFTGVVATEVAGSNSAFNVGNLIRVRSNGTTWGVGTASGVVGYSDGDVLMFAMDQDAKKIWVGKNGTWMNSGDPAAGTGPAFTYTVDGKTWVPEFGSDNNGTDHRVVGHFTSDSVQYAIPAGFTVLGS